MIFFFLFAFLAIFSLHYELRKRLPATVLWPSLALLSSIIIIFINSSNFQRPWPLFAELLFEESF